MLTKVISATWFCAPCEMSINFLFMFFVRDVLFIAVCHEPICFMMKCLGRFLYRQVIKLVYICIHILGLNQNGGSTIWPAIRRNI